MADVPDLAFEELAQAHVLLGLERQLHAADVIEERPYSADLALGTITFGDDLEMRAELLGTESMALGTWLWGWANESGFPEETTAAVRRARDIAGGEIPALLEPELALDDRGAARMAYVEWMNEKAPVSIASGPAGTSAGSTSQARREPP